MLWLVSCAENRAVPHVDPVVTSRGDATGKGKYVLVRADKVVQSDSASWPNENAPHSILVYREVAVVCS